MKTEIYIPCEIIDVTLLLTPVEKLSKLEALALEAIYHGVNTYETLSQLLYIGHRPTLDLTVDMWRRGYLAVDLIQGTLQLTDQVLSLMEGGRFKDLAGGELTQRRERVMRELVSGHIVRMHRPPLANSAARTVPVSARARPLTGQHQQEIISILDDLFSFSQEEGRVLAQNLYSDLPEKDSRTFIQRSSPSSGGRTRPLKVIGVKFDNPSGVREQRLLELRIESLLGSDTQHLSFRILHPIGSLNARVRADIEHGLFDLAEREPEHVFFRQIRQNARAEARGDIVDPQDLVECLRSETHDLNGVAGATITQRHNELWLMAEQASQCLYEATGSPLQIRYHRDGYECERALLNAINTAEKQIVLSCPSVKYDALARYREALERALARRVSIFILWGRDGSSELLGNVINLRDSLRREHGKELHMPLKAARTGATYLVKDTDLAILTSFRFLEEQPSSVFNAGVIVSSMSPGAECPLAQSILRFSQESFPDYASGGLMMVGATGKIPAATWEMPALPTLPMLPPGETQYAESALVLWRLEWKELGVRLTKQLANLCESGALVTNGEHREMLWRLLRRPTERRLILLSAALDGEVMGNQMALALEDRLRGGLRALIGYGRADADARRRLEALRDKFPDNLGLVRMEPQRGKDALFSHTELLIGDRIAVISSFGLLANAGYYDSKKRRRTRSEVGIRLRGDEALNRLLKLVVDCLPEAEPFIELSTKTQSPLNILPAPVSELTRYLQEFLSDLANADSVSENFETSASMADRLRRFFMELPDGEDPDVALDWLQRAAFPQFALAVACCLDVVSTIKSEARTRWLRFLAAHTWHEEESALQAFVFLQESGGERDDSLPPAWVLFLATCADRPYHLEALLPDAIVQHMPVAGAPTSDAVCLACMAIEALLLHGVGSASECLDYCAEWLPAPLQAIGARAKEFFWTHGQVAIAGLRSRKERAEALATRDQAALRLATVLNAGRNTSLKFDLGRHTWNTLFAGSMAALEAAQISQDVGAARDWLLKRGGRDIDWGRILDDTSRDVLQSRKTLQDDRIVGSNRVRCIGKLREISTAAWTWVDCADAVGALRAVPVAVDALRQDLNIHARALDELCMAATNGRFPEAPLLRRLRANLTPLLEVEK